MNYNIKKGVYIVDGLKKSSIYDCNNDKHYWVDIETYQFLKRLIYREVDESEDIIDIIETAKSLNILEETNTVEKQEKAHLQLIELP